MINEFEKRKLIAVLTIAKPEHAVPVANALAEGGITAIELTLRTGAGIESIREIRRCLPEIYVGAGTVLNCQQVRLAADAGACFAVAPGTNPKVIKEAAEIGLPFAPGVFTPSDIEIALECGCKLLKYFPASSCGMAHLNSMSAPYRHLGIKFIPLGGINLKNLAEMLSSPIIAAVGGSWLAKPDMVSNLKLDEIRANAQAASEILKSL